MELLEVEFNWTVTGGVGDSARNGVVGDGA